MAAVVQQEPFSAATEYEILLSTHPGAAVATFAGYVRDFSGDDSVEALELEHYPGMAERVLTDVGETAAERFGLNAWRIVHRYGMLNAGEIIVWVAAVADHRGEALSACECMMDTLKTDAPFWKREHNADGMHWVAARETDDLRRTRWNKQ